MRRAIRVTRLRRRHGRRFRILTLVDDFTRECLGLVVDTSLTGPRVARELDRIAELRSYPCMIVTAVAIPPSSGLGDGRLCDL